MTSENHSLPQPSQNNTAAAAKKNFFGSEAKFSSSSFFKHGQNVSRAPSPPLSYISSDSSCGSYDSLVLSGESASFHFRRYRARHSDCDRSLPR